MAERDKIIDGLIRYMDHIEKENTELANTNRERLKRIDDLREEKLLIESQLQSALAKLDTIEKINKMLGARAVTDPADIQLICLALAELALHRPGMNYAAELVAERIAGEEGKRLLTAFKETSADLAKPYEEFKRIGRGEDPQRGPASGEQGGG